MRQIILIFTACFSCSKTSSNQEEHYQIITSKENSIQREADINELLFYTDSSNTKIIQLNHDAVELLQKAQIFTSDSVEKDRLLNDAITKLDMVIKQDSSFYLAYVNKSIAYRVRGQYNNAIRELEEALRWKNYPEAIFGIGLIYEKQGKQEQADQKYKEAYNAYQVYVKTLPSSAKDEVNMNFVLLLLEGKEKSLARINNSLKENPNDTQLLIEKNMIESFDRQKFISSF